MSTAVDTIEGEFTDVTGEAPDSTGPTRPYPVEVEVAEYVMQHTAGWSIPQDELAERLGCEVDSQRFSLGVLRLRKLLRQQSVVLWAERGQKTYRILSEEEKITHEVPRIDQRLVNAIHQQREVIAGVDVNQLSPDARVKMDRAIVRNGYFAVVNQASKRQSLKEPDALRRLLEDADDK